MSGHTGPLQRGETEIPGARMNAEPCPECDEGEHVSRCYLHPEYDPTPWCSGCGAKRKHDCHCGPIAENE